MNYLVDTSVVLWSVAEEHKLNARALDLLSSPTSTLFLSTASVWEIAIKYSLGSLPLHEEPEELISDVMRGMGMHALHISHTHAIEAGRLPNHHRDPFDRMLIAQARAEEMVLLTADRVYQKYKVELEYCGK
jgi:PIN domain nuclease of toxin-antitoxin system